MTASVVKLPTRQWSGAKFSSISPEWNVYSRPVDHDIRNGLGLLRARARELAQNSDHARGFIRIVRNNIIGAPGFVLQSRATFANGRPDTTLREQIEREWREWGKRGHCEITGKFSWKSLQRHVIETIARDGEAFLRWVTADTRWGIALQIIDPDAVDITFDGEHQGREIRMGVELDAMRRPVAYWVNAEPGIRQSAYRLGDRLRIPADEMLHCYLPEFVWQTRGVPWMATAASRMHMIQGVEDAEVTAARAAAAKFAGYEAQEWAPPPEPTNPDILGADGQPLRSDPGAFAQDVAPGSMEVVPYGYTLKYFDPTHPNAAMPDFLKWGLRSIATGLGVSYNTLGSDAEGVNYTSLRFFLGVERDHWMEAQDWFQDEFPEPVRAYWTTLMRDQGIIDRDRRAQRPRPGRHDQRARARTGQDQRGRRGLWPDPGRRAAGHERRGAKTRPGDER